MGQCGITGADRQNISQEAVSLPGSAPFASSRVGRSAEELLQLGYFGFEMGDALVQSVKAAAPGIGPPHKVSRTLPGFVPLPPGDLAAEQVGVAGFALARLAGEAYHERAVFP